jgi:uncharacterized DUF497 family protein
VITFDPAKRDITLRERGIDFAVDAEAVFAGRSVTTPAKRTDYGELRFLTVGWLKGRMTLVIWTPRGEARHIISMRYCHAKEHAKLIKGFDEAE